VTENPGRRIAYFAHVSGGGESGVFHKMASQVDAWRALGATVGVFVATRDDPAVWDARFSDVVVRRYQGPRSRISAMIDLVREVRRFRPRIVYLRWDLFYPPMAFFPRDAALVVEVNTDDLEEYKIGSRVRLVYHKLTRDLILRRARALVFVTSELSRSASFKRFKGRHVVITNGIDLDAYPELTSPGGAEPRLVFVGSAGQPWHGIDKMLELAGARPAWGFEVAGMWDGMDPYGVTPYAPPNVIWHGPLDRDGVIKVLALADVAVGTLALHRKGMDEACALKIREYLAVGLPVLYGYTDPDADALGPYVLRLPNTESNVVDGLADIEAFVQRSRGVRVPRSAIAQIDVARKEEQRMALFDALAKP